MEMDNSGNIYSKNTNASNLISISFIILAVVYFIRSRRRKHYLPPGPTGLPFLGYLPFLGSEPYKFLDDLATKYGYVFSMYLGRSLVVVLNDWEGMKDAFNQSTTSSRPPWLFDVVPRGLGFASVNGRKWNDQRRLSVKILRQIGLGTPKWEALLKGEVKDVVESLQALNGEPIETSKFFSASFVNNIMTLLYGDRLSFNHPTAKYVSQCVDTIMSGLPVLDLSNFFPGPLKLFLKLGITCHTERLKVLHGFTKFIEESVGKRLQAHENDDEDSFVRRYFLEVQKNKDVTFENSYTESSLYANTLAMLVGGGESVRNGMVWLLVAVANFPEIQSKVQAELENVIGKENTIPWAERTRIPYTVATIMESLRLKPVIPINPLRMVFEDIKIQGFDVPNESMITVNTWAIHNDPRYWPDPAKFQPERFLLDGGKQINFKPDSYMPFSFGKRKCPAQQIAMMEIFQYFTTIMQQFTVLPEEGYSVKPDFILGMTYQPKNVKLRFLPR